MPTENELAFKYDDEYNEDFMESDEVFASANDFDRKTDTLDRLDDEYSIGVGEFFDELGEVDAIEAEALAAVQNNGIVEGESKFATEEEVLDDLSDEIESA